MKRVMQIVVVIAMTAMLAVRATPARADGMTERYVSAGPGGDGTIVVGAGYSSTSTPTNGQPASVSPVHCTYVTVDPTDASLLGPGPGGSTDGTWIIPYCTGEGDVNPMLPYWAPSSIARASASPATVARQAVARLPLPEGMIRMSPDASQPQMVNERTWLWIDPTTWQSLSATASAGAVSATAKATPVQVMWNLGDGDRLTCNGPGAPYDPSKNEGEQSTSCTYVWPRSSATEQGGMFTITATIVWRVTWTAVGAPGGGSLGSVNSPPSQVSVQVTEGDAFNTSQ